MKKLLLHSCCAPCSTAVIERLKDDFDITIFYYNPNIQPREEYEKRLSEQKRLLGILKIPFIEGEYEEIAFEKISCGLENVKEGGARCYKCFEMRLGKTFEVAKEKGFDMFATTLSVSPMKNAKWINEIGQRLETDNLLFLESDFKKKDGYKRSIELSKQFNLYRQHYCGCLFSLQKQNNN